MSRLVARSPFRTATQRAGRCRLGLCSIPPAASITSSSCRSSSVAGVVCRSEPNHADRGSHVRGDIGRRAIVLAGLGVSTSLCWGCNAPPAAKSADSLNPPQLSIEELMDRLARNFEEDQYYVTGNVDRSLFAENCIFTDPSIRVEGTEKYASAVAELFDAATSKADLISIQVVDASTIDLTWRLEGVLTRGGLRIKPYTGSTRYTAGVDGRVVRQEETWSISVLDAFVSCFFPSFGSPPAPPADELRAALAS